VLIREAFRLGIGLKDTAEMMQMSVEEVQAYGLSFRIKSAFPPPPGQTKIYNLFPPEHVDPLKCSR